MNCQLTEITGACRKNGFLNEFLQARVRVLRKGKRGLKRLVKKIRRIASGGTIPLPDRAPPEIRLGDWVEVRNIKEIAATLDDGDKFGRCFFIDEMIEYCGGRYRVLKAVDSFYDETKGRMCRARNVFLLEGVTCSGRQRLYQVNCDRNCFFFWHRGWLRKVDGTGSAA